MPSLSLESFLNTIDARVEKALDVAAKRLRDLAKKNAPVDTGDLRKGIKITLRQKRVREIAPNVFYATFVENGSSKAAPQPFMAPAKNQTEAEIKGIFERALFS